MVSASRGLWLSAVLAAFIAVCFRTTTIEAQMGGPSFEVHYLPPVETVAPGPISAPASAGPVSSRTLTLEEARQLALANNKALALAHLTSTKKGTPPRPR